MLGVLRKFKNALLMRLFNEFLYIQEEKRRLDSDFRLNTLRQSLGFCGNLVRFNGSVFISSPEKARIGNNVHIGNNAYFKTEGGLVIGNNTHISRNVTIYTSSHNYHGDCLPYDDQDVLKSVVIGKNVWIGMNVCVAPGVEIGDGAVIGLGAVIARDVPPLSIVGNQPYRTIRQRDQKHYLDLEARACYGGINGARLDSEILDSFEEDMKSNND